MTIACMRKMFTTRAVSMREEAVAYGITHKTVSDVTRRYFLQHPTVIYHLAFRIT